MDTGQSGNKEDAARLLKQNVYTLGSVGKINTILTADYNLIGAQQG
jgi:hypothetical protein